VPEDMGFSADVPPPVSQGLKLWISEPSFPVEPLIYRWPRRGKYRPSRPLDLVSAATRESSAKPRAVAGDGFRLADQRLRRGVELRNSRKRDSVPRAGGESQLPPAPRANSGPAPWPGANRAFLFRVRCGPS